MSLYGDFGTDADLERNGVLIQYGDTTRIRLARAGGSNKKFKKIMESLSKPYRRQIATDTMSTDKQMELLGEAMACAAVLSWETLVDGEWVDGIERSDGDGVLPFTKENIMQAFQDLPDLLTQLADDSGKAAIYQSLELDTDAKN